MTTPSTNETWNPERVAQLRAFIGAGMTCSQIAAEIGVTRNAVIGKIHRLGLGPGRPAAALGRPCPPRTRRPRLSSQRQMLRLISADAPLAADGTVSEAGPVDSAQYCSLLDLEQGKCRWPVSERPTSGSSANFIFCGNQHITDFSYCAGHAHGLPHAGAAAGIGVRRVWGRTVLGCRRCACVLIRKTQAYAQTLNAKAHAPNGSGFCCQTINQISKQARPVAALA
jgi:GcrA cell cycle regulator